VEHYGDCASHAQAYAPASTPANIVLRPEAHAVRWSSRSSKQGHVIGTTYFQSFTSLL